MSKTQTAILEEKWQKTRAFLQGTLVEKVFSASDFLVYVRILGEHRAKIIDEFLIFD